MLKLKETIISLKNSDASCFRNTSSIQPLNIKTIKSFETLAILKGSTVQKKQSIKTRTFLKALYQHSKDGVP